MSTKTLSRAEKRRRHARQAAIIKRSTGGSGGKMLMVVAGLVVAAFVAVFILNRASEDTNATGEVEIRGSALPMYVPGAPVDDAVGKAAPDVEGTGPSGEPVSITPGDGGPMIVAVLAHWCPNCNQDMDVIVPHLEANPLQGITLRAISTYVDPSRDNYPPTTWLREKRWPSPVIMDNGSDEAALALGTSGTPFWVFIDADGNVVSRWAGQIGVAEFDRRAQALRN